MQCSAEVPVKCRGCTLSSQCPAMPLHFASSEPQQYICMRLRIATGACSMLSSGVPADKLARKKVFSPSLPSS
jgi:hypothetical protein